MATPTLDAELDDLYGRYSSLSQQIDSLGLTDSYGAVEKRGVLDHERKKLWQQFEQYKADRGPEYEDWKQRKIAQPSAPVTPPSSMLGKVLGYGERALTGALDFPLTIVGQGEKADLLREDAKQRIQEAGGDPESGWGTATELAGALLTPGLGGASLLKRGAKALTTDPFRTFKAGGSKLMELLKGKAPLQVEAKTAAGEATASAARSAEEQAIADLNTPGSYSPRYPETAEEAITAMTPPPAAVPPPSQAIRSGGRAKAVPKKGEALGAPGAALEGPRPAPPSFPGPVPRGTPPSATLPPPSIAQMAAVELQIPVLNPQVHAKVVNAAAELIKSGRLPSELTGRPTDILAEAARRGIVGGADFEALLTRHGLTRAEFADDFLAPLHSLSGRELGRLSYLQRLMGTRGPATEQLSKELQRLGLDADEGMLGMGWWRRLDNVRRGLLVSQVSTAMRNFETQVGRLGLDVLQAPLDSTLQRALNLPQTVSPLEGLEQFLTVFRDPKGTTALTDQIFKAFPAQRDRMFLTYSSDILMRAKAAGLPIPAWAQGADAALSKAEGLTTTVNFANRFQEFLVRRGVFQANLAKEMGAKGKDLLDVIGRNASGEIPPKAVERAVTKALQVTFAEQPAYGSLAHDFVRAVNRLPGATFAIPFPRFLTNAIRFQWEYSPLGILNYLSPAERAAFAAGDTSRMSKAIIGTGLLGAAWQFRNSEYAGERWYEAKLPNGTIIDLRPFNPFASYLFLADTVKRMRDGTLNHLNLRDIAIGVLSANVRGGTGLYLIDQAITGLATNANTLEKAVRRGQEFGGEVVAGFLTPLKQVNDVLGQFDEEYRLVRDQRAEPFLGPIKAAVPGLAQQLPPAVSPTRTGLLERREPLVKQATGLLIKEPKNAAEAEFDRLGFSRQEILKPTGDYEYDRRRTELMGPLVERLLVPLIESPAYQRLSTAERGVVLSEQLKRLHHTVNQTAEAMSAPEERQARKLQHKGRWQRALAEERAQ